MAPAFTFNQFLMRFLFALILVLCSYNPTGYSFSHWLVSNFPSVTPVLAVCGSALVIGWAIYIRATIRSLGTVGMALAGIFLGCVVWLLADWGLLSFSNVPIFSWVALFLVALILGIGISWSHIRRRMTGQVDTDDIEA